MAENPQGPQLLVDPTKLQIIRICNRYAEALRPDGLTVFLDCSKDDLSRLLNQLRAEAPAESLIRILGILRGHQISLSYARRYMPEALPDLEKDFATLTSALSEYAQSGCRKDHLRATITHNPIVAQQENPV